MQPHRFSPPGLFLRFFQWYCNPKLRDSIEGDLIQLYNERRRAIGKMKADRKFMIDVLLLCRPGIIKPFRLFTNQNTSSMYKSYFIVALRNMLKQKALNILNVLGLSIGIAAGLIIAIHIREELSYETSIDKYENIYRLNREGWATSSPVLAAEFHNFFQDVDAIGRFSLFGSRVVNTDRNNPGEATGYYADSTVLKVFGFKVVDGDQTPLGAANTVVITRKMAERFFGDASPIGQNLRIGNGSVSKILKFDDGREMPVTAVIEDLPVNSHLKFDYLVSMATFYRDGHENADRARGWMSMYTYFRAEPDVLRNISERMPRFIRKYYENEQDVEQKVVSNAWRLMPIKEIHLHSNFEKEMQANSSIVYVYIFIAIEILILLVASANFMSLFTTQTLRRIKEVGMRKIMGAKPLQIMAQFFTEVSLLVLFSALTAIAFCGLAFPFYNDLSGKMLGMHDILQWDNLATIGIILVIVILISGLYPTFFISGFKTRSFLGKSKLPASMPTLMRNGMVVFQFFVSVSLIAGAFIVRQQMHLMKDKDLGFDKAQVINIKLYGDLRERALNDPEIVKNEFLKNPDILMVGQTGRLIGERLSVETVVPEGKDAEADHIPNVRVLRVDEGFLDAMNIQLLEGRNFSRAYNDSSSYIINESAARAFGLANPIDEVLYNSSRDNRKGKIIGVIRDYHFASLHALIEPMVLEFEPRWADHLVLRTRAGKTRETVDFIKSTVEKFAPNSLFLYQFLDDRVDALYRSEDAMGKIFQFFSVLAIIIACLGLFGLSSYTIEMRTREIGIRKVLGATVHSIILLISSGIFRLIAVAFFVAVPLTWYAMDKWLDGFAYKVEIDGWIFFATGAIVILVAALAIGFRTLHAALANPVKAIRTE